MNCEEEHWHICRLYVGMDNCNVVEEESLSGWNYFEGAECR